MAEEDESTKQASGGRRVGATPESAPRGGRIPTGLRRPPRATEEAVEGCRIDRGVREFGSGGNVVIGEGSGKIFFLAQPVLRELPVQRELGRNEEVIAIDLIDRGRWQYRPEADLISLVRGFKNGCGDSRSLNGGVRGNAEVDVPVIFVWKSAWSSG